VVSGILKECSTFVVKGQEFQEECPIIQSRKSITTGVMSCYEMGVVGWMASLTVGKNVKLSQFCPLD
jgi:hypothetical protein